MKRHFVSVVSGLTILIAMFITFGLGATPAKATTTYQVATDSTFPPFEFANSHNKYVGIDIDLLHAIAKDQASRSTLNQLVLTQPFKVSSPVKRTGSSLVCRSLKNVKPPLIFQNLTSCLVLSWQRNLTARLPSSANCAVSESPLKLGLPVRNMPKAFIRSTGLESLLSMNLMICIKMS